MLILLPFLVVLAQLEPLIIPGERLTYDVSSARFGRLGRAEFTVNTLENGSLRLAFDFDARVLLFKASDHTSSELDPTTLTTIRYVKRERSPVGGRDENVTVDRASSTWQDKGKLRILGAPDPLDELSFIYLIRSLKLAPGEERIITRHFDPARNPVRVRASDGNGGADIIEMHVPDKRQSSGVSVLRFHLSRDDRRVPIRIESNMPVAGRITMRLVGTE
jgi:hypothetical protein